jgi:perosamine synthetase
MVDLGFNYRLTDLQCALGRSQLRRLDYFIRARERIAEQFDAALVGGLARPLRRRDGVRHVYHLYVVSLQLEQLRVDRDTVFHGLRAEGIGVNVHYIPVHLHPFYRRQFATRAGQCPVSERAYERILSLPMHPRMTETDVADVLTAVEKVTRAYQKRS